MDPQEVEYRPDCWKNDLQKDRGCSVYAFEGSFRSPAEHHSKAHLNGGSTGCIQCSIAEELCALSFHSSQVETLEIGGVVCCPQGPLLEGPLFILSLFAATQAACTGLEN